MIDTHYNIPHNNIVFKLADTNMMVHIPLVEGTGDLSGTQTIPDYLRLGPRSIRWLHVKETHQCELGIFDQEEA